MVKELAHIKKIKNPRKVWVNEAIQPKTTLKQIVDEYKKTDNAKKSSVSSRRAAEVCENSKQGNELNENYP